MSLRRIFDNPYIFALSQQLIPFTVWVYQDLIRRHCCSRRGTSVLDIGCGLGAHRKFFTDRTYTGIDINSAYIDKANRRYGGGFQVMDATCLEFPEAAFASVLCVATFHHLSDEQVRATLHEALRVVQPGGVVQVIDPVIPANPWAWLKRWVFANDRGRYQRSHQHLRRVIGECGQIVADEKVTGWLHDVAYFALVKSG